MEIRGWVILKFWEWHRYCLYGLKTVYCLILLLSINNNKRKNFDPLNLVIKELWSSSGLYSDSPVLYKLLLYCTLVTLVKPGPPKMFGLAVFCIYFKVTSCHWVQPSSVINIMSQYNKDNIPSVYLSVLKTLHGSLFRHLCTCIGWHIRSLQYICTELLFQIILYIIMAN